jgi:ABC-2 type transport system ATP-binding protein
MMSSTSLVVGADGLRKTYKPDVRALDGLSFAVSAGSVFALLGPNGAGKTTTVRILTTLSRPDQGRARVAGFDVLQEPGLVRSAIGSVNQHTGAVDQLTGRENLAMQGALHGMRGRDVRRRVSALLDQFGLTQAANRQARTYSGGMRRRLDIATVLVHRPAVLFLDEPTTGLDPEGRADLWSVLTGLATEAGTTILVTTHYLEEADQYADKIAIVD